MDHSVFDAEVEDYLHLAAVNPGSPGPITNEDGERRFGCTIEEPRNLLSPLNVVRGP